MDEEWNIRYEAAEAGRHAPGQLCECLEMNGDKGTFRRTGFRLKCGEEVMWTPFSSLHTHEKRLSCYGAVQDKTSSWQWRHNKTGLLMPEHIKAARRAKLRRILWRHIPTAVWVVFHLMELAAMRKEKARLERIRDLVESTLASQSDKDKLEAITEIA